MSRQPRASRAFFALALMTAIAPSCTKTDDVTFLLRLPGEVRDATAWLEVGAYEAGACPSIGQLSGGLPRGGLLRRVGFASGSAAPAFKVDKGTYAFAATARNTQCEVLASGCTAIEVPGSSEITINLKPSTVKGGKCPPGSACRDAECVQSATSDATGVGCNLEVVGAGPLEALSTSGADVLRPAIAAVTDGFVIAYSQIDGEKYRLTTLKVGNDGGPVRANEAVALPFNRYSISPTCPDDRDTKGIGLQFDRPDSRSGLAVVPHWPCSTKAMTIFTVVPDAKLTQGTQPTFDQDGLESHVMSNRPISAGGYLTHTLNKQSYIRTVTAGGPGPEPARIIGPTAPPEHLQSWVAASAQMVAVLVQTAGGSAAEPPPGDTDADVPSAGSESKLYVQVADLTATRQFGDPIEIPGRGTFGSIAVQERRAVIVSTGEADQPVNVNLLNLGDSQPTTVAVGVKDQGSPLAADVAVSGDRLYVAAMLSKGVSVVAMDGFSNSPKEVKQKALARDFRVKQFMGGIYEELREGYLAIAANGPRVGVVWMTGERINAGEEVGGWAVLACR